MIYIKRKIKAKGSFEQNPERKKFMQQILIKAVLNTVVATAIYSSVVYFISDSMKLSQPLIFAGLFFLLTVGVSYYKARKQS